MDDHSDPTDDREVPAAGDADDRSAATPHVPPVPPVRRSLFDRPLFWLGLVGVGVVLAVVLSFAAERTDLSGSVGDVGHYCQQVRNVKQITSVNALGAGPDGIAQARALVQELTTLESVAPEPVHDDVTTVRRSAETLVAAVTSYQTGTQTDRSAALGSIAQAVTAGQGAIERMTEYTQEACGIDLGAPDTAPVPTTPSSSLTTSTTR